MGKLHFGNWGCETGWSQSHSRYGMSQRAHYHFRFLISIFNESLYYSIFAFLQYLWLWSNQMLRWSLVLDNSYPLEFYSLNFLRQLWPKMLWPKMLLFLSVVSHGAWMEILWVCEVLKTILKLSQYNFLPVSLL